MNSCGNTRIHEGHIGKDWLKKSPDLNHNENLWDAMEMSLHSGLTLLSSIQNNGDKLNVSLHKLIKIMCVTIKAKGGPSKY